MARIVRDRREDPEDSGPKEAPPQPEHAPDRRAFLSHLGAMTVLTAALSKAGDQAGGGTSKPGGKDDDRKREPECGDDVGMGVKAEDTACTTTAGDADCGLTAAAGSHQDCGCQENGSDLDCGLVESGGVGHSDSDCSSTQQDNDCGIVSSGGGGHPDSDCGPGGVDHACGVVGSVPGTTPGDGDCEHRGSATGSVDNDCGMPHELGGLSADSDCGFTSSDSLCTKGAPDEIEPPADPDPPNPR